MRIEPFALERYFARYEFTARYLASCSDCDGLALEELLALADDETRALWRDLRLGYTESLGHPLLRAGIASLYEGAGADDVLTGAPEELIFLAMNCLLEPGDHVIATFPAYQSLHQIAESMGCEVTRWQPDEGRGWLFDPDFVRAQRPAAHQAHRGQLPPQPHRRAAVEGRVRRTGRHRPGARHPPVLG